MHVLERHEHVDKKCAAECLMQVHCLTKCHGMHHTSHDVRHEHRTQQTRPPYKNELSQRLSHTIGELQLHTQSGYYMGIGFQSLPENGARGQKTACSPDHQTPLHRRLNLHLRELNLGLHIQNQRGKSSFS